MAKRVQVEIVGQKVKDIRKMTRSEMTEEGWNISSFPPTVIVLENGLRLYASRDPEGNGPGCLYGKTKDGKSFYA